MLASKCQRLLSSLLLILIACSSASGATHTVCNSGCDYTLSQFNSLSGSSYAGDTFDFSDLGTVDSEIEINVDGTSGSYVTIKGGDATFTPGTGHNISWSGDHATIDRNNYGSEYCIDVHANYLIIEGFELREAEVGIRIRDTDEDNHNIRIRNNYILLCDKGISTNDASYITIGGYEGYGNEVYACGHDSGSNDIIIESGSHDAIISYNHIWSDQTQHSDGPLNNDILGTDGIVILRAYNVLIEYNLIHGHQRPNESISVPGLTDYGAGENALDFKGPGCSTNNVIARFNQMYNYHNEAIINVHKGSCNIYIYGNEMSDGKHGVNVFYGYGDESGNPDNVHIWSNVFYDIDHVGISQANGTPTDVNIHNNTFVRCGIDETDSGSECSAIESSSVSGSNPWTIKNNVLYNNEDDGAGDRRQVHATDSDADYEDNLMYHTSDGSSTKVYTGSLTNASGFGTSTTVDNPDFTDQGNNVFTLTSDSPAIDNGSSISGSPGSVSIMGISYTADLQWYYGLLPTTDFDDVLDGEIYVDDRRTYGWDQGAYIYTEGGSPPDPEEDDPVALLALYLFNSQDGTDSSGGGYTLTGYGTPGHETSSPLEGAASFDADDSEQKMYYRSGSFLDTYNQFSVMIAFKMESNDGTENLIGRWDYPSGRCFRAAVNASGDIYFAIGHSAGSDNEYTTGGYTLNTDTPYWMMIQYDGLNDIAKIFIRDADGNEVGTDHVANNLLGGASWYKGENISIGHMYNAGSIDSATYGFDGLVDEVHIHSGLVTEANFEASNPLSAGEGGGDSGRLADIVHATDGSVITYAPGGAAIVSE